MHAKSGLRVVLKWKIFRPDSVIAAVMPLGQMNENKELYFCGELDHSKLPLVMSLAADVFSAEQYRYTNHDLTVAND